MAAKQPALAGMENKKIKELSDLAEAYADVRDKRMALTKKEVEAQDDLLKAMKRHKITVYRDDDFSPPLIAEIEHGEDKVKVKRVKEPDPELN